MAELGQLLGTLLSSLAHARRIADEETAIIAEHYKDNPLLEGMSLPRIRVPEMRLDVPMLIESHEEGESNTPEKTSVIAAKLKAELGELADREDISITATAMTAFQKDLTREINRLRPQAKTSNFPREVVVRAADQAFATLVKSESAQRRGFMGAEQRKRMSTDLRRKASEVALKKEGTPPTISASMVTAEVKEGAGQGNVSRISLVLKEEGLEWTVSENEDGSRSKTLTPE